jgi:endonuclease IV
MKKLHYGYHISLHALEGDSELPDFPIQTFFKSPMSLRARGHLPDAEFMAKLKKFRHPIFLHGTYLANLTKPLGKRRMEQIAKNIADDLDFLDLLPEGRGVCIHHRPGNPEMFARNLWGLLEEVRKYRKDREGKAKILIENSKGSKIEELFDLDQEFRGKIGFCIDTCHLFVTGYDFRNLGDCKKLFRKIRRGLPDLELIHFNDTDSMTQDIHEEPGYGYIGNRKLGGNPRIFPEIARIMHGIPLVHEPGRKGI